ncbi:Trk system potassium transporter TrkH [Photorhabdus laumondii subsp. laumondii]|uniref:Trk system potassium uptake protein n=2 Tax=Photorhabdus laumondii subsp. laumondii TaxID=141679 RepID=Q7MZ95_PHOLL|nr:MULTISPECIES: Trk system potassium transporter TrkH [Photorhabdus]AWK43948.1 potassium transporter [Photorhabdus laumondii subsp. laumondii]AXG44624.1 Trk system potassium transporter TrkH [Photorhabdus laumondii subsp. laumondii]AXG49259.1 Trk system potassium transporter TrkH [Photorhabdus laumondii subsp. laumondii]KTL63203.1 potassium transporter [Photorhabdus laumondii subsp. laumondii]MCC8386033.1 Trk system potassium transporter TrkH [Photorhabdus laumondii]
MHFRAITRIVGLLVILFSVTMIIPGLVALIYRDGAGRAFSQTFIFALIIGLMLWIPNREQKHELKPREGFLIVALFWTVLGSVGALPFIFSEQPNLSITDAFFESFSGLTTTGATTLIGLDSLPKAILFYRQMLQWLGGMGIIVLAVAILPLLGVGGMQLYRAEMPGPLKDNKMRPRIAETAKTLWLIYVLLTIACALALWAAGMSVFDAISHSFSTIAIGGFSTHDASIGYFNSPAINTIIAIFLLISGCNFGLHFAVLTGRSLTVYWRDPEFRMFISIQLVLVIICTLILWHHAVYKSGIETLNQAFFQVVSMATTAGFSTDSFARWPSFLPILLLCSAFIGGCAGSTGGGLKVIRILLLFLQGSRELKRLVHPNAVYTLKLGRRALPERIIEAVWGFFSAYALVFIISLLLLIATGVDELSAFSAIAATLNNLGPGLGVVADNFTAMNPAAKWILVITMLFGRLEVFTLLVLFTPTFWRE